jgi:hypothetical protein
MLKLSVSTFVVAIALLLNTQSEAKSIDQSNCKWVVTKTEPDPNCKSGGKIIHSVYRCD